MSMTCWKQPVMMVCWLAVAALAGPQTAGAQPARGEPGSIYAPGHAREWSTRPGPAVVMVPPPAGTLFGPVYQSGQAYASGQAGSLAPNVVPGWGGLPPSGPVAAPYPPPAPVHRNNGSTYYRR